ncbi:MAG: hypothetical protein K0A99_11985 [Desulfoarculaceae bacterium]|nr:hypothetical protein [Desulfoarculaceae bacterium]
MAFLLKCSSKSSETIYQFQLTNSGLLDMVGRVENSELNSEDAILFQWEFDEVGGKATLIAIPGQHAPLSPAHFSGLAVIARIEAFVQAGVFFKAAQWTNYKFQPDTLFCAWLKAMIGPEICRELYFSFHLGSFGEKGETLLNTSMLTDGPIVDMAQEVNNRLSNCLGLHTRIVGFGYRQQRLEVRKNGDVQLRIVAGDNILVQHEFHNRYAPVSIRSTGVPSTAKPVSEVPTNAKAGQRRPAALEVECTA